MKLSEDFTVIVPVRAGSERIKGKNLRDFHVFGDGRTDSLLSWKIKQLKEVFRPEQIVLSSNWSAAIEVAGDLGVRTHRRDESLCLSDSPFNEVILDATKLVDSTHMIWAPVTSPFFGPSEMVDSLTAYSTLPFARENGLLAVSERRSYFFLENSAINFPISGHHIQTQNIVPILEWNWAFSMRETDRVRRDSYMFSTAPEFFIASSLANLDIDYEEDFLSAQALIPLYRDRGTEPR